MSARTLFAAAVLSATAAVPARADDVDRLFEALALPDVLAVMQDEGLAYGESIAEGLLEGRVAADWGDGVARIYDLERMREAIRAEFRAAVEGENLAPMLEFFNGGPGASIVELEVSAREAMLDDDVEAAARETAALAMVDGTERYRQIERFIEANDLIETNVVSALNANLAFYEGLSDGGALPAGLTGDQIVGEVWSREAELRQSTTEWVTSFLMLAYQPLPDDDLEAYIAFSETEPGEVLNRAVFTAFEAPFREISRQLGRLAATELLREDI